VTVSARVVREEDAVSSVDEARFAGGAAELRRLRDAHGLEGSIDVATVLRMPDVMRVVRDDEGLVSGRRRSSSPWWTRRCMPCRTMRRRRGPGSRR
jgi:hypothetical protein